MGDPPSRVAPDFRRRGISVRFPVRRVVVLIRLEEVTGAVLVDLSRLKNCTVRTLTRIGHYDLGTVRREDGLSLPGYARRHRQQYGVPESGADHGVGYSRISRCRVENDLARDERPAKLAIPDHAQSRPVLDRPTRIEEFELGVKLDVSRDFLVVQAEKWGLADLIDYGRRPSQALL